MRALQVSEPFISIFPSTLAYVSRYDTFPGIRFRSETSIVSEVSSRGMISKLDQSLAVSTRIRVYCRRTMYIHMSSCRVVFAHRSAYDLVFCDLAYRVLSLVLIIYYIKIYSVSLRTIYDVRPQNR